MKVMSLAIAALLAAGTATVVHADDSDVEISYEIYNFYNPSEPINDGTMRVTAHNNATGVNYSSDRESTTFTLPVGNYTFSGRGQWCYLQPKTLDVTSTTTDVTLLAGCE